jgi:hypothetical protein
MAKCANCSVDASVYYPVTSSFGINYCQSHLPRFLKKTPHLLQSVVEKTEAVAKSTKKKTEPVVEEAPVTEEAASDATDS